MMIVDANVGRTAVQTLPIATLGLEKEAALAAILAAGASEEEAPALLAESRGLLLEFHVLHSSGEATMQVQFDVVRALSGLFYAHHIDLVF